MPRAPRPLRHAQRDEVLFSGPAAPEAFARVRDLLWRYHLYDPRIVVGALDAPTIGVVIDQRIRVEPLRFRGPVRIVETWDEPTRAGYRYEALSGHPETGTTEFEVALRDGDVRFRISSHSAPAHWLARLGAPFARAFQRRAVESAFRRARVAARGEALA